MIIINFINFINVNLQYINKFKFIINNIINFITIEFI